ncbi:fructose-2,6-bisphosphatase [Rubrivivax gelatinosus]|uniref:histidine phosphatase family protein n=1 Tax=Rubrivivax gelatinosus TaxID=28068 RepID=UPI001907700A|nr:histidine phosphatase family protein [Rubrivivax gelatinosus]MBK1612696.1 fructose-2,6-bisphosphatase [Rubrivivax gelatinosus]
MAEGAQLWAWRHPRVLGAAGRCLGRTDLPVDRRRAKRLAHRIRAAARRHGLPHEAVVSPLARCRDVGRWLRRWGWRVEVDARLVELDFGTWDGRLWSEIAWEEVERWQDELWTYAPGGGEPLQALAARVHAWAGAQRGVRLLVGHAGWLNTLRSVPPGCSAFAARDWPAPPRHGECVVWRG